MAGLTDGVFKEKISPFLIQKLRDLERQYGRSSPQYRALALQYEKSPLEDVATAEKNRRHYEAEICAEQNGHALTGLERLYRRCMVIDLTMICAAHCRYCLRGNYPIITLSDSQILDIAKYCGNEQNKNTLNEVLITGGDPLIIPQKLNFLLNSLEEYAPNIRFIRIGTRLPSQQPDRIHEGVLNIFETHQKMRFEVGTQINHGIEFFDEVVDAFQKLQDRKVRIYAQNVLLKNINDSTPVLIELYDLMRLYDIDPHYLFHCIPIKGMHHFRTTVKRGLDLIKDFTCSGNISGRAKPMFAAMTDIGKITFYEGVILDRDQDNNLLLQSNYSVKDRQEWACGWQMPPSASVDENGLLRVWYLDGSA
jgi:lysine 2,3-aminomutase